jgi:MarR family transcriptional regulator, organic hydroperoxide resistance regulator
MSEELREEPRSAAEEILRQLDQLHRHLVDYGESRIGGLGLTMPQAELLRGLGSPLPMNQIAGRMHCDASNVTGIVDRLEGRGLVERRVRADDRRVKEIALTPEGRRLKRQVDGVLRGTPGFGALHAEDQATLRGLLARVLQEFGA